MAGRLSNLESVTGDTVVSEGGSEKYSPLSELLLSTGSFLLTTRRYCLCLSSEGVLNNGHRVTLPITSR